MIEYNFNSQNDVVTPMANKNQEVTTTSFTLEDLFKSLFRNWYWFAISTFVCLCAGAFYVKTTPKVYKRDATILVKDSRKGGSNDILAFNDILGVGRRNVDNELFVIQSRRLMEEVVDILGLATRYNELGRFKDTDLYHRSPIEALLVDDVEDKSYSFDVTILPDKKISITNFGALNIETRRERNYIAEGSLNDTLSTPVGKVIIRETAFMNLDFEGKSISVSKGSRAAVASAYRKAVSSAVANKMSSIITLSINDNVPQRAEDILNTLIHVYNNDAIRDKQKITEATAKFIDERLEIISKDLGAVDEEIESFKKENKLFDLKTEAQRIVTESTAFRSESIGIENQIHIAEYVRDYLNDESKTHALIPVATAFSGASGSALNTQIENYNIGLLRREKLIANGATSNPVVLELDHGLAAIRNSILSSLKTHIEALNIQLKNLRSEGNKTDRRISEAPSHEKEYLTIARQQRIKEELYLYLLNKREENSLSIAITESNARIVDPAFGSLRPIAPRSMLIMIAALILGLLIPFGIIYLNMSLSTAVKSRRDIERVLTAPYLGDIPAAVGGINSKGVVVRENGRDSVSEAFRILRTNMSFMNVTGSDVKVIQVISSMPHAGKTFISTNLAVTIAMSGKKVLLVDMDLRRRTLTKQLGHRGDANGLTAYMSGMVNDIASVISNSGMHDNLDMMYAGLQPPNPAEMLLSSRLDDLFAKLREMYDYIIIDSVPAMAVADGIITNRLADLCMYVIRENISDVRQLPDVERLHKEKKLQNMCIVLNGSTFKRGYGYAYGTESTFANSNIIVRAYKRAFNKKHRN